MTPAGGAPRWEIVRDDSAPHPPLVLAQLSKADSSSRETHLVKTAPWIRRKIGQPSPSANPNCLPRSCSRRPDLPIRRVTCEIGNQTDRPVPGAACAIPPCAALQLQA